MQTARGCQFVEKVCFLKNSEISLSLTPNPFPVVKGCVCFVGSASCRAFGHTRPASMPGLSVGLPPLDPVGGYAPKQGCFGCLPKVLHDAKPAEQATLDTPFLSTIEVFRQTVIPVQTARGCFSFYIEKNRLIIISRLLKKLSSPTSPVVTISL